MKQVLITLIIVLSFQQTSWLQLNKKGNKEGDIYGALKLRSIGPAFCSGRIADIAIHPEDDNVWYVAVGSGGVWKTTNAGVTWDALFDNQSVYSTGCITIDPNNPNTIWLGTGENVGGRHVGFGDGVYKSADGGDSWTNVGLKESQHISKIIVHPSDPNTVWVAAQGPLWNKGGERGLYKSTDGGGTWKHTLGDNEWTGVTDIVIDPRDPMVMYAATWQRHRTVAAYMGGGPNSGIYKSVDGGETWDELTSGIPTSNLGKIGLAISPQNPDVLYAAIELDRTTGGVFKSTNRGATWTKMSDAVSGATGPHYYQELYASPHAFDRLYLMDVRVQVSDDGGANFRRLQERDKHSDNHALAFRADDPDYLLIGTDAGIYESFDLAENWRFIDNLPLTQYYKVAVDDSEPFYKIYGGTQDNGSHGGPSQTNSQQGIRNSDWFKTLFADGHQSATEPGNPNITYAETQQGGLFRIDQITGEMTGIQPSAGEGEDYERFNWDAPIVVSSHDPARLYFASSRVWRSDNRGDDWTAISGDLTRDQERITLPIMGKVQSWDNPWDVGAMSNYNTITSLAESSLNENIIYAGTDDGYFHSSTDGGDNWTSIEVNRLPGVPQYAFVNDVKADLHNEGTVYLALDHHKSGDFSPYLYKSTNYGQSWSKITGNIPDNHLIWRVVQDHVDADLLFAATEFGIYFTRNGGTKWNKLKGAPTISFRDLAIQRRENDLVGASFGRGFYVLDDYSVLRDIDDDIMNSNGHLFAIKPAKKFYKRDMTGSQGAGFYTGDNPPYGATFTYMLPEFPKSEVAIRKKKEKELAKNNQDIPFPGWDALAEQSEKGDGLAKVWLTIKSLDGQVINRVKASKKKGLNRSTWNLRYASKNAIRAESNPRQGGSGGFRRGGAEVPPGEYTVTLEKELDGNWETLSGPKTFTVERLLEPALTPKPSSEIIAFKEEMDDVRAAVSAAGIRLDNLKGKSNALKAAFAASDTPSSGVASQLNDLDAQLKALDLQMNGNPAKEEIGERNNPTLRDRMFTALSGLRSSHGPTGTALQNLDFAKKEFEAMRVKLNELHENIIPQVEKSLLNLGIPWIEGQPLPQLNVKTN